MITPEQKAAREAIANNTSDTTEFGNDTAIFRELLKDQGDEISIELNRMDLTKLPNFGKDLGFQSLIVDEIVNELPEITQTHLRDFLILNTRVKILNVGNIDELIVDMTEFEETKLNFVGPIISKISLSGVYNAENTITLTAPTIIVSFCAFKAIIIGPGCKKLTVKNNAYLKTITLEDPASLEYVRFHDLDVLEFNTPLPDSAEKSGNFFGEEAAAVDTTQQHSMTHIDQQLIESAAAGDLAGVQAALAAGADPNIREDDEFANTPLGWATNSDNNIEIVRILLAAGADPFMENSGGSTALQLAEEFNSHEIANILRQIPEPAARNISPEFAELPVLPYVVLKETNVPFSNQQVYDFEENEEVPVLSLLSTMGNIVFKAKNSYFTLPIDQLNNSRHDGSQIRYKCTRELSGAPFDTDVDLSTPYYYIQGNGNFIVPLSELISGLRKYKVLELVETDTVLENVASAKSVQTSPGVNRYDEQVNIVSADHCQGGTKQKVFELRGVILTSEETGGNKKSTNTRRNKRVTYKIKRRRV